MPYAQLNEEGRMVAWSREKAEGFDVEFSNGEYIDANCVDGLEDFIIVDGEAVYSPSAEKQVSALKKKLADTDYVAAKIAEGAATREDYADLLALRQSWRDQINELRR